MDYRLKVWICMCLRLLLWSSGLVQIWHGLTGLWFETTIGIYGFVFFSFWLAVIVTFNLRTKSRVSLSIMSQWTMRISDIFVFVGLVIGFRALIYSGLIISLIPAFLSWRARIVLYLSGLLWTPIILHLAIYLNIWIIVVFFALSIVLVMMNCHQSDLWGGHTDRIQQDSWFIFVRRKKYGLFTLVIVLFPLTLISVHSTADANIRLDTIPLKGHGMESWAVDMDENQKTQFKGAEVFKRIYSFDGKKVLIFIIQERSGSRVIHRPEICLKGSGWNISSREKIVIGEKSVSSLGLTKSQKEASCCYWFGYGSSKIPTYSQFILYRLAGALKFWKKRSTGYLVLIQSLPGQPVDFKEISVSHEQFFSAL